jgi:t-SNARE complex subunit (syntaxin)
MTRDIEESEKTYKNEPETRVKKTAHRTLTSKFRDVLRHSQQIQTEFRHAIKNKMKRQLKIANKDATEEEIE